MEQSLSWEANRFSSSQEIPYILWKPNVHYRTHKCLPVPWARSIQSMPLHITSWRSIVILSSHLRLGLRSFLFPSGFPTKTLYAPHWIYTLYNHIRWWNGFHTFVSVIGLLVLPLGRWARGGAVGWGTALQDGRSRVRFPMVSLEFFIDIILPAALWPWGWLSL